MGSTNGLLAKNMTYFMQQAFKVTTALFVVLENSVSMCQFQSVGTVVVDANGNCFWRD